MQRYDNTSFSPRVKIISLLRHVDCRHGMQKNYNSFQYILLISSCLPEGLEGLRFDMLKSNVCEQNHPTNQEIHDKQSFSRNIRGHYFLMQRVCLQLESARSTVSTTHQHQAALLPPHEFNVVAAAVCSPVLRALVSP